MVTIILALFGSLTASGVALAVALRDTNAARTTKRLAWCACVAGLVGGISAAWSAVEDSRAQDRLLANITGGDSYPELSFRTTGDAPDQIEMRVQNMGEYTLYDVHAQLCDLTDGNAMLPPSERGDKCSDVALGTILPGTSLGLGSVSSVDRSHLAYKVMLIARNGVVWEDARALSINGQWEFAYRMLEDRMPPKTIKQTRSPRFPLDSSREPDWDAVR